jgi:hypothetical protein
MVWGVVESVLETGLDTEPEESPVRRGELQLTRVYT